MQFVNIYLEFAKYKHEQLKWFITQRGTKMRDARLREYSGVFPSARLRLDQFRCSNAIIKVGEL